MNKKLEEFDEKLQLLLFEETAEDDCSLEQITQCLQKYFLVYASGEIAMKSETFEEFKDNFQNWFKEFNIKLFSFFNDVVRVQFGSEEELL